jgi:hypothetical protein
VSLGKSTKHIFKCIGSLETRLLWPVTEHLLLDLVPDLVEINDTLVEVRERALFTSEPVDQLENE